MSTTADATLPNLRSWLPRGVTATGYPIFYVMWLFSAMRNAGYNEIAVIDLCLSEIGDRIRGRAKNGSAADKEELRRLVSEFSESCEGLVDPDRPKSSRLHPSHH